MVKKKKPVFDWDKMKDLDQNRPGNKVWYKIHDGESPVYQEPDETTQGFACYAGLLSSLRSSPKSNFVSTRIELPQSGVKFTKEDCITWIDLCQVYGLLPWYVVPEDCIHPHPKNKDDFMGKLVLFTRDVPQSKLYAYLDNFRKLREDRGFVRSIMYLHLEKGMDFYVAYTLASHFHITNQGHHTLQIRSGMYNNVNAPVPSSIEDNTNLMIARNLFKFAYDTKLDIGALVPKAMSWKCNSMITNISKTNLVVPAKRLLEPEISKIIREPDDKKAAKLCEEFNKNK